MRRSYRILILVLASSIVSACANAEGPETEIPQLLDESISPIFTVTDYPPPSPSIEAVQVLPTEPGEGQSEVPPAGFLPGDPELKASDPTGVSIASGRIQFIEFFAFW